MILRKALAILGSLSALIIGLSVAPIGAAELSIVSGSLGQERDMLRKHLDLFEERTGHTVTLASIPKSTIGPFRQYSLWLAAQNEDLDIYHTDLSWAPQLGDHFMDLSRPAVATVDAHLPALIASQTVQGALIAIPMTTSASALYYRTDLLQKYEAGVPSTWAELTETAQRIMDAERDEGVEELFGFLFQAAAYEGLTANILEWITSHDGGQIVEDDGTISINNQNAAIALNQAQAWLGTITPEAALSHREADSLDMWQSGKAVFMRHWSSAYALLDSRESGLRGKFDVAPLPSANGERTTAMLRGRALAVSKYSRHPQAAIELVLFLTSQDLQKERAIDLGQLPTLRPLYDDADLAAAQPLITRYKAIIQTAIAPPAAATGARYNAVSKEVWTSVHNLLSGTGTVAESLQDLERKLRRLKGPSGWQ